jgi:hypothetical protein
MTLPPDIVADTSPKKQTPGTAGKKIFTNTWKKERKNPPR